MVLDLILVQCLDHEYEIVDLLVEIDINSVQTYNFTSKYFYI